MGLILNHYEALAENLGNMKTFADWLKQYYFVILSATWQFTFIS
jgi:hypothetical protein